MPWRWRWRAPNRPGTLDRVASPATHETKSPAEAGLGSLEGAYFVITQAAKVFASASET
jgi:hypothetical protein